MQETSELVKYRPSMQYSKMKRRRIRRM